LSAHARYSDRVIRLARILFTVGMSLRKVSRLLRQTGIPVTAQTVHQWCRNSITTLIATVELAEQPDEGINLLLRPDLCVRFKSRSHRQLLALLEESSIPWGGNPERALCRRVSGTAR
jgi:hypothetical protein